MVSLTIDGKRIEVPEGTTVLRAAQSAGIEIPTLCDHPELTPYGGCRLCLVEVEGIRNPQPSCTLPASNNMVVQTNTPKIKEARKFVLTLIFSERNHFCMYCQVSGGDCELQNAAYREGMTHWPLQPNWQGYQVDASHPYIIIDHNRCILCRRCVRACGELVGNFTLGFEERGAQSLLVADIGTPLGESSCISCGTCVQVCPTGAMIDRWSAYRGKETQLDHTTSICVGCSLGCGVDLQTRDNHVVRVYGDWENPVNEGILCEVGRFKPMVEKNQRVNVPLVKKNGSLKAATWEEALNTVANALKSSANQTAALISTRLNTESINAFSQIFRDGLKASIVTSLEEGKFTPSGAQKEGTLADIDQADVILIAGEDLTRDHQVLGFAAKRANSRGSKLVVLNAETDGLDAIAAVSLKPKKGAEGEVFSALTSALAGSISEETCKKTGVSLADLNLAAEVLKNARKAVVVCGKEISNQPMSSKLLFTLASKLDAAVVLPKGGANSLAAARQNLDQSFSLNGEKAVFVALGDDTPSQRLLKKLEGVPFLAVQASYYSPLTAQADVVFPVTAWGEETGHYVNYADVLQETKACLTPSEEVWSNLSVLQGLAGKLGINLEG
ncbi:MAG TPA: 2Fe-2S iron-sulfur cluster-binding protein [Anaerolineaceae bacterium]